MKKRISIILATLLVLSPVINFKSYALSNKTNIIGTKSNTNISNSSNASNASNSSNTSNTSNTKNVSKTSNISNTSNTIIINRDNTSSSSRQNKVDTSSNLSNSLDLSINSRLENSTNNKTIADSKNSNTSDINSNSSTIGNSSSKESNTLSSTNSTNNSRNSNHSNSSKAEIVLDENVKKAVEIINKGAESISSYENDLILDGSYKNGTDNSFIVVQKDERVYDNKLLKVGHISFTTSNKENKTLEDFIYKDGSLYKFNGKKYDFLGQINEREIVGDGNYWSYIEPILFKPQLFKIKEAGDDIIVSYEGNDKELYEVFKKPFSIENTKGNIMVLDLQYIFSKKDGILKNYDFKIEEDYIKLSIVGEVSNINGFNDLRLPKQYSLD